MTTRSLRPATERRTCPHCGRGLSPYGQCRSKFCPRFAPLWAKDWQIVAFNGLRFLDDVALVTVTAPGVDLGLAWDPDHCRHSPSVPCSGPRHGCRVVPSVAERWNESLGDRWSRLHRKAALAARRRIVATGLDPIICAKAIERQERGVDHLHLVLDWRMGAPRERSRAYFDYLRAHAASEWFGMVDMQLRPAEEAGGHTAASYVSKYVSKSCGEAAAPISRPIYIGRHLTTRSGITMRALRWKRFLHHALELDSIHVSELPFLISLFSAFRGITVDTAPAHAP